MKRVLVILGMVATLGIIGTTGWFFFGDTVQEHLRRRPFDPLAWQGPKNGTNDIRLRMVDDLLRRKELRGISRQQLTAMLGEPDETPYFKNWDLVYWLGPERGFIRIDSEWLVLRLDNHNRVKEFAIVRD